MARNQEILISTVEQMEALASPVRQQIHVAMEMLGSCSVNELAHWMHRVPETLYYHVRMMEAVGILEIATTRNSGSRTETVFRLKGKRVRVDPKVHSPRFLKAMGKGCASFLRFAQRCFERGLERGAERTSGPRRSLRIEQSMVRLSPKDLAEMNRRLDGLQKFLAKADDPTLRSTYVVTLATAPLDESL